jgi:hypothetical protein
VETRNRLPGIIYEDDSITTMEKIAETTRAVNPSGKAGTQIPQLPLGDNSPPWGDNAVCT